jgi:hypothetical protein
MHLPYQILVSVFLSWGFALIEISLQTPRSRVLLEKLIVTQLVKNLSTFNKTAFAGARHCSLSCQLYLIHILSYYFFKIHVKSKSRDSPVCTVLGYGLDDRGSRVRFPAGLGIFLFTTTSRIVPGPNQSPIHWVPWALSVGVKRPGREADHSPLSSTEVK